MKKITISIIVLVMLVLAVPASAARELPAVGERINIFYSGSQEFPANTPFHVRHGWVVNFSESPAIGVYDFILEVDGEPVPHGLRYIQPDRDSDTVQVLRIYNFPDGMSGVHTFTGFWYLPCYAGDDPESCEQPNKPVLSRTSEVVVTFTP
jgi:hypothetical protein